MSSESVSSERYVPVHRRSSSSSSSRSSNGSYIYSREALLALAPPSHTHGADSSVTTPASTRPSSPHDNAAPHDIHRGWAKLNEAMRAYLRATCPEIAMNRKMRKSLEFHDYQHQRATRQQQRAEQRSREASRQRSSRSSSPRHSHGQFLEVPSTPSKPASPSKRQPQSPSTNESIKRSRSPTPRLSQPSNSRTRQAQFAQLHANAAAIATTASEGNWRINRPPAIAVV
ncbi:hypothetical protein CC1G_08824 [Coprinopsis cinerea okayama7|uniref:Uncharacterized protein n=1 Tax=Coprinopsis cinerea (strain Okayama-7 / 130 / ATCC MYA-4618 / FGSC 9003) TaxID=240176 RepID=A8P678_COPC7|nr:hypothetical protein CC1G_08824 [Coprinopsis cinerea okayama7\|eukprot:XP_001839098.1 hypothetical protein CC1G_08824 [Coprinopsis cinerea okayama7\